MLYKMKFLEPKEEKERQIYELLNLIVEQTENAMLILKNYSSVVVNELNRKLSDTPPKHECSNYPLLDEAETDDLCNVGIHHFTEKEALSIQRTMKRNESEYSGKGLNDIRKNHADQKILNQLAEVAKNTEHACANDYAGIIYQLYYDYMRRMGYISSGTIPFPYITKSLEQMDFMVRSTRVSEEQEMKFVFCNRYFRRSMLNKVICIIYADNLTDIASAFRTAGAPLEITEKLVFLFRSMKEFEEDMETFHATTDGYSIVSKAFNGELGIQSIFNYNPYNFTFEQVDPMTYIKKYAVTLYGVESVQIDPMTGHLTSLLKVPGFEDEFFSVLSPCNLQTKVEDSYKVNAEMIISDKVIVDGFRMVDDAGMELPKDDAQVVTTTSIRDDILRSMDGLSKWELEIMAKKNCFLKIVCHSAKPMNTPFAAMDQTTNLIVTVCRNEGMTVPISYDDLENPKHDHITPMIKEINIPFAKNIKQVELTPEWAYCGRLDDLMKLYVTDHISCICPDAMKKTLINFNIKNVSLVQVGSHEDIQSINVVHGVGWCPENRRPHDPCISFDHQGQWFLHIDLKEPIPVLTCRGIQFSLMKNSIKVVSNYGVSCAEAQDVYYHLQPVVKYAHQCPTVSSTINVSQDHPSNVPIILTEKQVNFVYRKSISRENLFSKKYTFKIEPVIRNSTEQRYRFVGFRAYRFTDAIKIYYKKTHDLGLPTIYTLPVGYRFAEDGLYVDVNIDDIPKNEIKDYTFYMYIRYMVLMNVDTKEQWLVQNTKVQFDMSTGIKSEYTKPMI